LRLFETKSVRNVCGHADGVSHIKRNFAFNYYL